MPPKVTDTALKRRLKLHFAYPFFHLGMKKMENG